jgi:hypothetical protein
MKFYLSRILGSYKEDQLESGPLCLYQYQYRALIGEVLVQQATGLLRGPYIPSFYQMGFLSHTNEVSLVLICFVGAHEKLLFPLNKHLNN